VEDPVPGQNRIGTHANNFIAVIMFYVYVLKSAKDNNLYIGSTNNLGRRLLEHNNGEVQSTKSRVPFELRYYESYSVEEEARHRESALKDDGRVLAQLKKRIYKSLQ
jgi:putative endonuclease